MRRARRRGDPWHGVTPWRIVALNLAGSIAFKISAIAAFIRLTTGQLVSIPVANLGMFLGAVAFFAGALPLIPEDGRHPVMVHASFARMGGCCARIGPAMLDRGNDPRRRRRASGRRHR
jgi:hypothetical protein